MDQICPKRIFLVKNEKSEQLRWILLIRISLGTIFLDAMVLLGQTRVCLLHHRPRGEFANENALALLGTSRPCGFNKNAKNFRKHKQKPKPKWKPKWKQKRKILSIFIFVYVPVFFSCLFLVLFSFSFSVLFSFSCLFLFSFSFLFFCFFFRFCFSFNFFIFYFLFFLGCLKSNQSKEFWK